MFEYFRYEPVNNLETVYEMVVAYEAQLLMAAINAAAAQEQE